MCTLSFAPAQNGYLLTMNRDERLARPQALPPAKFTIAGRQAAYPHEPGGGTWIGVNDFGVAAALLNLNIGTQHEMKRVSRGVLIPDLLTMTDSDSAAKQMVRFDLSGVLPFRLVGIFPRQRAVIEWAWDFQALSKKLHLWELNHWFSSGASDIEAQRQRSDVCIQAARDSRKGTLAWLQDLHRSHAPERGAFSICAHREDAATVSYTEIVASGDRIEMNYRPGAPCEKANVYGVMLAANTSRVQSLT
jgi:hypothetical protein